MELKDLQDFEVESSPVSDVPNIEDTIPEGAAPPQGFSAGNMVKNVPASAGRFVGGLADAVIHPVRTVKAVGGLAAGGVEKLIPGRQAEEDNFDALVGFYKDRYGSVDNFLRTLEEDPVGVLADASTALTGAGAAVGAASKLGIVSKAGTVAKVGNAATKAGQLTNPLSVVSPIAAKTKAALGPASNLLEKWSLRLTPVQKSNLGTRLGEITDYISKNKIVGSPETRFAKATNLMTATEDKLDTFFGQMSKGSVVKKDEVIRALQAVKGQFKNDRDALAADKQINQLIKTIQTKQGDTMTYKVLNNYKRTTYQNAYNGAGDKVLDDVEHAMGDALRKKIETGLEGLKVDGMPIEEFNKQYGTLLEARKLLKLAMGRSELSPWSERILGGIIGTTAGGPFAGATGALLGPAIFENLPVTGTRSAVSSGLRSLEGIKNPLTPAQLQMAGSTATGIERTNEAIGDDGYPREDGM